ncbi:MAG: hypothetical protein LBI14_02530 [Treponema sp.]|jgi:hypothetical protein|nr:hypothetical protein [Treponema sp.]
MSFSRIIKLSLVCVLAAGANYLVHNIFVNLLRIPLFLDTVFSAAVSFAFGLSPGLVTVLLTKAAFVVGGGSFDPFILCSFAEVLLVCLLKPSRPGASAKSPDASVKVPGTKMRTLALPEAALTSSASIFARLMLLYIVCSVAVSVLGGIIEFIYYTVLPNQKLYFSAEDTLKIGLLESGIPPLAMNILSRIPVNLVDRFIVIFGGYFISQLRPKAVQR